MPTKPMDHRPMDRLMVQRSIDLLRPVAAADLDRPTPCAGWSLHDLLDHMTAQHRGFAAAAAGQGADRSNWTVQPTGAQGIDRYVEAAEAVLAAFAAVDDLDQRVSIPELSTSRTFRAGPAIGFHFVDYFVHCWDVAQSRGVPHGLSDEVIAAVLPLVRAVPDGPERRKPGALFQPGLPYTGSDPMTNILMYLGRAV